MAKNGFSFSNRVVVEAANPRDNPQLSIKDCGKILELSASVWPFGDTYNIELPAHADVESGWNVTIVQNEAVVDETNGLVRIRDNNAAAKTFLGGIALHPTTPSDADPVIESLYCTASIADAATEMTLISSSATTGEFQLCGFGYPGTRVTITRGASGWLIDGTIVTSGSMDTPFS